MKISKKIYFSFGIMLILLIGTMAYSIIMQQNQVEITEDIIQNKNKRMKLANDVIDIINFNSLYIRNAIIINTNTETQSAKSKINENIEKGTIIFGELGTIIKDQESKVLIENFKNSRIAFVSDLKKTIELLESNKTAETSKYFSEHLINSHNEALNAAYKFLDYQTKLAENAGQTSLSNSKTIELMTIIFIVVSTIISLLLIYSMIKTIVNPIDKLIGISNEIAVGKFDANLEYDKQDEIGNLYSTFKSVVNNLNKIKSELNAISSSVNSGNLNSSIDVATYMGGWKEIVIDANNLISDLSKPYSSIQGVMSNIAIGIIPKSIENTYKGEFYNIFDSINKLILSQEQILEISTSISKGDLNYNIQLRSENDVLIKSIIKMRDYLLLLENSISTMSQNHQIGIIDYRIDTKLFEGVWLEMVSGINIMIEEHIQTQKDTMEIVEQYSNGFFNASLRELPGQKIFINIILNKVKSNFVEFNSEINRLINEAKQGNLKVRGNYEQFKGDWANLVIGVNNLLSELVKPLDEAISILQKLSEGDLTSKMTGDYKGDSLNLKNAINETIDSINDILSQVIVSIEEVSRGSLQVSDASSSLSQGATEQAASLEEITSSMSEIGSQTNANASSASEAMNLTNYAKTSAEKGNEQMALLNNAMNEITESSKNISKIIKVIDEIAFQTNLLALNAAVEAARAGRHGKGFAVVAEEVRNLAARSASAAKETAEMIEESIKVIQNGAAIAINTGGALEEIKDGAIKAADIVKEIAKSSQEQAQGIAQINEGLHQIDRVTQTNTASAEQSASAAEELSGQSINLKQMISRFKIANSNYNSHYNNVIRKETYNSNFSNATYKSTPQKQNLNDFLDLESDDFGRY